MPDIVILAVDDLARSRAFYTRALGLMPVIETPVYIELTGGVGLYQREGFARNTGVNTIPGPAGAGTTATELYFRVPDLAAACSRVEDLHAALLSARSLRPWGEVVAYYADPDGNVIALAAFAEGGT